MAITNGTYLASLINPEVFADFMDKKLTDAIKFAPLCDIDNTLVGSPGSVIKVPAWNYIGAASTTSEGENVTISVLSASSASATIHKVAKGVQITDEAVLSGLGDPIGEAMRQETLAIADAVDGEIVTALEAITGDMLYETASTSTPLAATDINAALEKFGEDVDNGQNVIVVSPEFATVLRNASGWVPASEIAADRVVRGAIGEAYGCQVIISNRLKTSKSAFILKPGAIRIFLKRDTLVEADRNIVNFSTTITASKHFVAYLYDASKAIKLQKKAAT